MKSNLIIEFIVALLLVFIYLIARFVFYKRKISEKEFEKVFFLLIVGFVIFLIFYLN